MQKRSYVDKLTDEDILNLLKILNYKLKIFVLNKNTLQPIPTIERFEDDNNKNILIRCTKIEDEEDKNFKKILEKIDNPMLRTIYTTVTNVCGEYLTNDVILIISDFTIINCLSVDFFNSYKAETAPEETAEYKYAHFMADKFGKAYVKDYNRFVRSYNKKLRAERENEAKQESIQNDEIENEM